ncbi:MAG: MASE1 domain-containing protein [Woeseiaceae bacterium]|nr:MASE1 domain-containing protein [Woeseiaceae bacterium]
MRSIRQAIEWGEPMPVGKLAMLLGLFAVAHAVSVYLGLGFYLRGDNISMVWPGGGVFMGALLIARGRHWGLVILTGIVSRVIADTLIDDVDVLRALIFSLNNVVEAVTGAVLMRWLCGGRPSLGKTWDVFVLILVGALFATIVGSLGGAFLVTAYYEGETFWNVFNVWWFADALGVLIVVPLVLAAWDRTARMQPGEGGRPWELAVIAAGLAFVLIFVFGGAPDQPLMVLDQPYMLFPFIFWLILRFDARFVTSALLAGTMIIFTLTDTGFGPFGDPALSTRQAIVAVQSFATVLMCSSLIILAFITERRRLRVSRANLELQLRHSQKLESIGTLAGGVAHDLNNPLTGVMNYAQLIQEELPGDSPAQEYAGEILTESEHMAGIVRNLLTFARQDTEHRERTDLVRVVDSTVRLVGSMLTKDGIDLEVDMPSDLHPVVCNPQEIRQVVMNLVTNARDALNEKTAEKPTRKVIRISGENVDVGGARWVSIAVEDEGIGIPSEIRDRLFDPFFTTKGRHIGTGLGLSISYGIVREHGGEIHVDSEAGKYTRFRVDLPVNGATDPGGEAG